MDPQQRVLLEICWQALERAGLDPQGLRGSRTGVFIGAMAPDYGPRLHQPAGSADGHLLTGTALSVVSGRVAYSFGLEGPAVTVDTACSSSLVAIHQAVHALRRGECTLALAGGVTVMSTPGMFVEFSRQGGLSVDGRCKAFGAEADGTGWAEGAGVLLLERRSQAERHGRPVLAVIRGSAVNQDGRSNGLTAPSGSAQQRVIRQALADARLTASEVDLVEAHGTGTALGDPIEAEALLATYGADRPADRPVWLGSVKSNLGHTQAAAGVAGVIKSVLALRHGTFPATLHADQPTSLVDWNAGGVRLLTEPVAAPLDRPVRAAVSGFGISGTNGHLILESGTPVTNDADEPSDLLLWTFSARSLEALADYAGRLRDWASAASDGELAAAGAQLARRTVLGHRAVLIAADRAELLAALVALATGTEHPAVVVGTAAELAPVFVFPGQGTQWAGMAYELLERSDVFWDWICRCDGALAAYIDWSVLDVLRQEDGAPALAGSDVIQPVLFAVMVALAELWRSLGVEPATVLGHSQGEITAACVAGAISLEDAARIVVLRSRALMKLTGTGGMLTVPLPLDRVQPLLAAWTDRLWPAILSGPDSTVIAGDLDAIDEFVAAHGSTGQLRRVAIDYAAHTPHIEALQQELDEILADLQPRPTEVTVCSSLTGEFIPSTDLVADYWYRGLRHPVRFADAVRTVAGAGRSLFLEVSPHPVLTGQIGDILRAVGQPGQAIGTLRRDSGWQRMLASFAQAWVAGAPLDWTRLLGRPNRQLELPGYPFEHRRYWLESTAAVLPGTAAVAHPLLAAVVELADGGWLLTGRLSRTGLPWLSDHAVSDEVLLPGTALLELAVQAGTVAGCGQVEDLTLIRPVLLPSQGAVQLQLVVGAPDDDGRCALAVHARTNDHEPWLRHATGTLAPIADSLQLPVDWPPAGTELDLTDGYLRLAVRGYQYGPAFQGLRQAWQATGECYAEVALPETAGPAEDYLVHPALLDAALHALLLAGGSSELLLPFNWSAVTVHRAAGNRLRVRFTELSDELVELTAQDAAGNLVATGTLTLRKAGIATESVAARPQIIDWVPAEAAELALAGQSWAVIGAGAPADQLVTELAEAGLSAASHYDLPSLAELGAVPPVVLAAVPVLGDLADAGDDLPGAVREVLAELLDLIQAWLGDERFAGSRLTVLSPGSGAGPSDALSAVLGSAVWGLVRSAAAEHPGRFALLDGERPNWSQAAAAVAAGDWQLAVREGELLVPRLVQVPDAFGNALDLSDGTVLVTGGTSGLGALAAERLVQIHGVRRLLLLSRRGPATPGAAELVDRLRELGAEVTVLACDVANRRALAKALDSAPRLVGVVHAAGVLDDAPVDRLSAAQLEPVLAAKADAAWHLHELTAEHELAFFIGYSSVAGTIGTAGQGNYAAANALLDGLAGYRHGQGLPATSIGWGLWQQATGLTGR
ncbi:MAG TPA: type I polyketide synthase, partial [Jatrophihabitans sp.]|nr:type I polyketide synthase [Jatrophihabitans sp.]